MKLLNVDCIEYMKTMPDESVDLIVTDPPYEIQKKVGHILRSLDERIETNRRINENLSA